MSIQAVLFDLWGTLITDRPEVSQPRRQWRNGGVHAALVAAGVSIEAEVVGEVVSRTGASLTARHDDGWDGGLAGRWQLFAAEFEAVTGARPPEEAWPGVEASLCTVPPHLYPRLAPDAVETLRRVKALGLSTALVSNAGVTTAPTLRRMLADQGMAVHLDELIFSDEVMLAKPHPGIFIEAMQALSVEPADAVFVGDSPLNDVGGAQASGIFAVQIGNRSQEGVEPDLRIDELKQLLDALAGQGLVTTQSAARD